MIREALLCFAVATPAVAAEPASLAAVGRVLIAGEASCSGTLVSADLVLTAGHCLRGKFGDMEVRGDRLAFQPGRTPGLPLPQALPGRIAAAHPIYGFGIGPKAARMGFDFGLLRLEHPVPDAVAVPLATGSLPRVGDAVFIAGYRGGEGAVARQRRCDVIEANHAFAALGCEVAGGESGSPMLRIEDGLPVIVGVLANKGRLDGQPVAFGPVIETAFDTVLAHLESLEELEN